MRWPLAASVFMVTACGFDPDPYRELTLDQSSVYSYEFKESHCSTGKQVFVDKERYCMALSDDVFNRDCAVADRARLRSEDCEIKNARL